MKNKTSKSDTDNNNFIELCSTKTKKNDTDWDIGEYKMMWEKHQKIYVYSDGKFIVTDKALDDSKDVVILLLRKDDKKIKKLETENYLNK